jgi:hypothetical protein
MKGLKYVLETKKKRPFLGLAVAALAEHFFLGF